MRHPAYPEYKESGVQWLGNVPEHWEVKRLKYSATINDDALSETTDPDFDFLYVDIGSVNALEGVTGMEPMIFENAPSRARRKVSPGDTIVSTVRTYLRAIAPITETTETLIVSTGFAVVRPRKLNSGFLAYALRESSFVESIVARSTGVSYPAVNALEIGDIAIPLPPLPEQTAIADFLDRETGRIDVLVAKKRRLVELLKEKRTALVSRTVTRGLPADAAREFGLEPHTRFKDSGIDWLGEVPEGWEVKKIQYLTRLKGGSTPLTSQDHFWGDSGTPWVSPKDMKSGRIRDTQDYLTQNGVAECASGIIAPGHVIVVVRSGILRHTLPVAINDVAVTLNQDIRAFLLSDKLSAEYLKWLVEGNQKALLEQWCKSGTTVESIEMDYLLSSSLPVPPLPEQTAIATYLDRETLKIDRLVEKVEAAVGRLQEYRTALITAAVTGKIDVREVVNSHAEAV
jgi:type I restriction enzyme S subunit